MADTPDLDALSRCFAAKVAAWFEHEGTVRLIAGGTPPAALTAARQGNMALALALSRWTELAALSPEDAIPRMSGWLDGIEARAVARDAAARAAAVARARSWFEDCRRRAESASGRREQEKK